ncbi:MAG: hypothetical protein G5701_01425 [Serratia symbiotica]|nr:hypothetical protein [Serratia symbiotica]
MLFDRTFSGSWHYQYHLSGPGSFPRPNSFPQELIYKALALTDTVTLRKRKLPLESMVWLVVGMVVFCNRPMTEIVNLMGITERTGAPFTARS